MLKAKVSWGPNRLNTIIGPHRIASASLSGYSRYTGSLVLPKIPNKISSKTLFFILTPSLRVWSIEAGMPWSMQWEHEGRAPFLPLT